MPSYIEIKLRAPNAYVLARAAIEAMEKNKVWPTPQNFELWSHYVCDPNGQLAKEIGRIISEGGAFTDGACDQLAATFLGVGKLTEQIRDTGDALTKELNSVSKAIKSAQKSSEAYGVTLEYASKSLGSDKGDLRETVETLASATRRVQEENKILESRLSDSTAEVSRLREHLEQVRRDATTDGLTNLANRKSFDAELQKMCAAAEADGLPLTLAVLDIDHFKIFNDTWGHQTGDQVLRYVAGVIGSSGGAPRLAARYGGEEFALLFPGETASQAFEVLEQIRIEVSSRILKRRSTNEDLGAITLSAGLAERAKGEPGHELLDRADSALYASKRNGRNRVTRAEAVATAA
ncbi:MAG: GGDEF domain-containing protein [Phenylobacterium zucineum]|nr:MAG: GGDEF domain-containing protein [Phenylobacterium zucineum]